MQDKKIIVEYSHKQDAFHIQYMSDAVKSNLDALLEGVPTDFKVVGVFDDFEAASELVSTLRQKQKYAGKVVLR